MKKISLLIPIYGVENYIEQCARSLFSQSYTSIEYIFVDDCTKDRSIEILQSVMEDYPDRKEDILLIRHEHNKGLGAARRTAFEAATGEYIMHVDSDDMLPSNAVELLTIKAEESHADIIDGGYAYWKDGKASTPIMPDHIKKEKYLRWMLCQTVGLSAR